jgi:hypothetical protein
MKTGRPSSLTMSGWIKTVWHPLSIRAAFFKKKVTVGPFSIQSQIKCCNFRGGVLLTDAKLESEASVKLPLPMTPEEREEKTAAIKSSFCSVGVVSETVVTVLICVEEDGHVLLLFFAGWAFLSVNVL